MRAPARCAARRLLFVGSDVGVLGGEDRQSRPGCGVLEVATGVGHHRLRGRSVQRQNRPTHLRALGCGDRGGDVERHTEPSEQCGSVVDRGAAHHGVDEFLAGAGCLPHLCDFMPDVVCVEDPDVVTDPAAKQFRAVHRNVDDVEATPVVSTRSTGSSKRSSSTSSQSR